MHSTLYLKGFRAFHFGSPFQKIVQCNGHPGQRVALHPPLTYKIWCWYTKQAVVTALGPIVAVVCPYELVSLQMSLVSLLLCSFAHAYLTLMVSVDLTSGDRAVTWHRGLLHVARLESRVGRLLSSSSLRRSLALCCALRFPLGLAFAHPLRACRLVERREGRGRANQGTCAVNRTERTSCPHAFIDYTPGAPPQITLV